MRYLIPEEARNKILKKYQRSAAINYGIGVALFLAFLIIRGQYREPSMLFALLIMLIICTISWYSYSKMMKSNLSTEYEIIQGNLLIYIDNAIKSTIPLQSIRRITQNSAGYQLQTPKGDISIVDRIENKEELIGKLMPSIVK